MKDDFKGVAPESYRVFGYWNKSGLPYAFFVRNAKKVSFNDIVIDWKKAKGLWKEAFKVEASEDVYY